MSRQATKLLLVLLTLAAALHLFRLSEPRGLVFDEIHFGGFASAYCCSGQYFFDIHPPHGKLLIAGAAALGGYRGDQSFGAIGEPVPEAAWLRLAPALAGTLVAPVLFVLLLQLGASRAAAFLGGLAALLDNALLIQTRIIALDGILLLATFAALSAFLAALHCEDRVRRTAFAFAAGLLAGSAVGTKFTGLVAGALLAVCLAGDLVSRPSAMRLRVAASLAVWVLAGAVAMYAAGWLLHFGLLGEPGPGNVWGAPSGEFLHDTVEVHRRMFGANYGLTKGHPYSSPWWSWPLMLRPVFYWTAPGDSLYFLGNPVLWWGTVLGLVVVLANRALFAVTDLELSGGAKPWPRFLWIPLLGYLVSFVPLMLVPRALFLYHYLTPLLFGLLVVVLWLDHVGWTRPGSWRHQRASFYAATVLLVIGFLAMSPFTFSFVKASAYQQFWFELFPSWR